jgi:virginiamycin A acetyltransferase
MKQLLKIIIRFLAVILISPMLLWHWLWVPILGRDRCLEYSYQMVACIPGLLGNYLRQAFLQWTIRECHPTVTVCFGTLLSKADASLRENVYIGPGCHLGLVCIEKDALIASGVHITSGANTHGYANLDQPIREQPGTIELVTIGANAWIGSGAIVMADVGKNSIIGAGSVVTKPIPDAVIAVGIPARVVQRRS